MRKALLLLAVLALAAVVAWRLLPSGPVPPVAHEGPLRVVATIYPLAEFARQVGGDKVRVTTLVPPGAEPHDYEPTPQDIVAASQADVFLMNGGVDAWVERILPDLRRNGVHVLRVADALPDAEKDPHVWLDPALAMRIVAMIREAFVVTDSVDAPGFDARATAYEDALKRLDMEYASGLRICPSREIIASHDALGYMARHYGLEVVPIAGLSPDEEPSPSRMAEIATLAKASKAKYIFFEALVSPKLAETIAQEAGAKTLVFDPLEGLTPAAQAAGEDYLSVMRRNLENLRTALQCR
jgi:zinc transport system substrate-binding protein